MSTGFPFLAIANKHGVPYPVVARYVGRLRQEVTINNCNYGWPPLSMDMLREVGDALHAERSRRRVIHNDWMRDQILAGWRYGAVYRAGAKTDPRLVHYDELPA